jgi:hypothetical protein
MPSEKVYLFGREAVGGKLLEKNVFFNGTAAPFLDDPASHQPCDYFLHVSSSNPHYRRNLGEAAFSMIACGEDVQFCAWFCPGYRSRRIDQRVDAAACCT